MLLNLTIKEFLTKTTLCESPSGTNNVTILNAALAAVLTEMIANKNTRSNKGEDKKELMKDISSIAYNYQKDFVNDIDADTYNKISEALKLPEDTKEEIEERNCEIQEAYKSIIETSMNVARKTYAMMDFISRITDRSNQNTIIDACVAMMSARTAVLGAILNVRINLKSIENKEYVNLLITETERIERETIIKEQELLEKARETL